MSNNTATIKTRKNLVSTRTITMTALLAAISYVLAFLEFPVPLSPSFGEFLPFIKTKLDVVLFNALPFNILKGLVIGAITMMIYKKTYTDTERRDLEMTKMDYLELLVDEIHSTTVATIGSDGHPQTRIIDMMYYDEEGVQKFVRSSVLRKEVHYDF